MTSSFHTPHHSGSRAPVRPTIVLGAHASLFGTVHAFQHDISGQRFFAIDLDLRSAWIAPSWVRLAADASRSTTRVRSAWIAGATTGPASHSRLRRLITLLQGCKNDLGLRTIVIPRAAHLRRGSSIGPAIREIVSDRSKTSARIAVGVRAIDFADDRRHLDQLASTRRLAEEWDLDIALDLTGNVSLNWEAEAAVIRLMPRLTLVRLQPWIATDRFGPSEDRQAIALRTVAMLADQGYTGSISLVARPNPWWMLTGPEGGEAATLTRELILDRYDRQSRLTEFRMIPPHEIHPQDRP